MPSSALLLTKVSRAEDQWWHSIENMTLPLGVTGPPVAQIQPVADAAQSFAFPSFHHNVAHRLPGRRSTQCAGGASGTSSLDSRYPQKRFLQVS